jgi:hypothetical protein
MSILIAILGVGLWLFALLHLLAQIVAKEIGYLLGRRVAARRAEAAKGETEAVGFVATGLLGLLAFTMALTISFAQSRYEDRRDAALQEANAVGTAWLRAQAVGHPAGEAIARQLEGYLQLRRDYVVAPPDQVLLRRLIDETNASQTRIWVELRGLTATRTDPVAASLMASLNELFDLATAQRYAFSARPPGELVMLLLGLSVVSIGVVGYGFGTGGAPRRILSFVLLATWTAALTVIVDLSNPRLGELRTSPAVYDWTAEGMGLTLRR